MKITTYKSINELPQASLEQMNSRGKECFFLSPDWFRTLEAHGLPPEHCPRYYVVSDEASGRPLCILPMMTAASGGWLSPRRLQSFSSFYSMDFGPIGDFTGATGKTALEFLLNYLLHEKPAFDIIDIRMLTKGDAPAPEMLEALMLAAFKKAGAITDTYFQFDNWVHKVAGESAASYYGARPSRLKNTIKRKRKKFEEAHKLSFLRVNGHENLEKAIADYQLIYAKSWKDREAFPDFIPELIKICARDGILRLGVIYADEKPAAAQFWMVYGGIAMIYKLAYDEDYAALSAGSILSKEMMDQAIDSDRVAILDYGVGNDGYKRDWMTEKRQKIGLIAYNRSFKGRAAAAWHLTRGKIRRLVKPAKPTPQSLEYENSTD